MTVPGLVDAAIGWVDVLWAQSVRVSVVFFAVLLLSRFLRRRGPALHLVLWSLVFVRLLLPPDVSHPWSIGAMLARLEGAVPMVVPHDAGATGIDVVADATSLGLDGGRFTVRRHSVGLAAVWLLGFVVTLVLYGRRVGPAHAVARAARPVSDPAVLETADRWRRCLRIRRQVRVVTSAARISPYTIGVASPIIVLPQTIVADGRSLEAVVAHEMAHVARWDALWLRLQHLVHSVYFFHPLVWIAGAKIDMERERLCDAMVVAAGRLTARSYGEGLLDVLQLDLQGAGAPTMTARKRRIGVRIHNILERDGAPRPRPAAAVAVACLIGLFLLPLGRGGLGAEVDIDTTLPKGVPRAASNSLTTTFDNPLPDGRVTWMWGPGRDPWTGDEVFHRGIDVAADAGTPVLAPADGVVVVATESFEPSPASGTVVAIDHGDGWTTFYSHLGSLGVSEGQRVARGEAIATIGSTGKSTGPHLHFEIRQHDEPLDPADFVSDWKR